MSNVDYGFKSTDEVQYDKQGLPIGVYKAMIVSEEPDPKGNGFIAEYEILSGDFKGKKAKVWYNVLHTNQTTANIAKQSLKRIADATGKAVSPSAPLKGRVLTLDVQEQKKDPRYTEIKQYLPENYEAPESNLPPM